MKVTTAVTDCGQESVGDTGQSKLIMDAHHGGHIFTGKKLRFCLLPSNSGCFFGRAAKCDVQLQL